MKALQFKLVGKSPLLMHGFTGDETTGKNNTPQEQAEDHVYRMANGNLCIPQANIMRALISGAAGTLVGGKGKKTYSKVIAASVFLEETELDLGAKDYAVDKKPVVIKATGGRVIRYRARLDSWTATGTLNYDETEIPETSLKQIMKNTGARVGLMDFRPEKKGPYGRFDVEF